MPPKQARNIHNLDNYVQTRASTRRTAMPLEVQQEIQEITYSPRPKRIIKMDQCVIKGEETVETKKPDTVSLHSCLSQVTLQEIFTKCKSLKAWADSILEGNQKMRQRFQIVFQRSLKSHRNSLWSIKYQPKTLSELFDQKAAENISLWIQSYTRYRNHELTEQSNSFIDNMDFDEEDFSSIFMLIHRNNWKCKALVLKGRSNIGKTSLIRVISKSLNYAIHQCAADLNQEKYLKQNNECTKSENIQITPKNLNIHNTNHNISRCFPTLQENKSEKPQRNALQFIRELNCVYPQKSRDKFFRHLNQSIESSKVPFVLSTVSSILPPEYSKYDYMELQQPSLEKLSEFFWMTFFIENNLQKKINTKQRIQKESIWDELSLQIGETIDSQDFFPLQSIRQAIKMFHLNLSAIYNFLQFYNRKDLFREAAYFNQRITCEDLLQNLYSKKHLMEQLDPKSIEVNGNSHFDQELSNNQNIKGENLRMRIRELQMELIEDSVKVQNRQQNFSYRRFFQRKKHIQSNLLLNIPEKEHQKVKKQLCGQFLGRHERKLFANNNHLSSLRPKELSYLPMIAVPRKSRKAPITFQETLSKFVDQRKVKYLLQFTDWQGLIADC